nr:SHOCT domain-containing protein [Pseudodesulfovibrio sp.]
MWSCNFGILNGGGPGWFMGGGMFGFIWMILFALIAVYLISKLFQAFTSRQGGRPDRDDSLNIIKEKFAKGELTADEYQRMKEVLTRQ